MSGRKSRVQSDGLVRGTDCPRLIARLTSDETEQVVSFSPIRIGQDGLFKFLLRALNLALRQQFTTSIVAVLGSPLGYMSLMHFLLSNEPCRVSLQGQTQVLVGP